MSENRIIGFTNPNHFLPMYVVIIYVNGGRISARFPSGDDYVIADITEDEFLCKEERIPVGDKTFLDDNEVAFAASKNEVYVEPVQKILEVIRNLLDSGRFKDDKEITDVLQTLLKAG